MGRVSVVGVRVGPAHQVRALSTTANRRRIVLERHENLGVWLCPRNHANGLGQRPHSVASGPRDFHQCCVVRYQQRRIPVPAVSVACKVVIRCASIEVTDSVTLAVGALANLYDALGTSAIL